MHDSTPAAEARPREVTVTAGLLIAFGLLGVLLAVFLLSLLRSDADHGQTVSAAGYVLVILQFALAGVEAASGIFLLRGREWARKVAIGICCLNVVGGLISIAFGGAFQAIVSVVLNIALIRMLVRAQVSYWCR